MVNRHVSCSILITLLIALQGAFAQDSPRTLYVMNALARTLSKMDIETGIITNNFILVGDVPSRLVTSHDKIYVVNSVPPEVMVIDAVTESVERRISLPEGSNPWDMAFTGSRRAYVSNYAANTLSVINLETGGIEGSINVDRGPEGILVVGNTAYVANTGGWPDYSPSTISVIDVLTDSVTKTIPIGTNPQELALSPDGNIHVLCSGTWGGNAGQVIVIDPYGDLDWTPAVVDTLFLGGFPGDIVITADGTAFVTDWGDISNGFLYSYNSFTGDVSHNASNPLHVGKGAMRLLLDEKTGDVFISTFDDDTVQRLDPKNGQILQTYNFGDGAQDMAILEPILKTDPWADGIVSFRPGSEWNGFGENFYPDNVLGPPDPDPNLTVYSPSSKPQEILSLGHGGEIVLEFSDNVIIDGEGVDLTIFENVFFFLGTDDPFIEAGIVAVSIDGVNFVPFPYDTNTFEGFAGVSPTLDAQHPTNPEASGGDSFDLADVGLPYARFVRITDAGNIVREGPYNGDFDLDAVVAVHSGVEPPDLSSKGDVNGDGDIDIADVMLAVNIITHQHRPTSAEHYQADCNGPLCQGDGMINILDAVRIVNIILGVDVCP